MLTFGGATPIRRFCRDTYNDPLNKTDPMGLRPTDAQIGGNGGCFSEPPASQANLTISPAFRLSAPLQAEPAVPVVADPHFGCGCGSPDCLPDPKPTVAPSHTETFEPSSNSKYGQLEVTWSRPQDPMAGGRTRKRLDSVQVVFRSHYNTIQTSGSISGDFDRTRTNPNGVSYTVSDRYQGTIRDISNAKPSAQNLYGDPLGLGGAWFDGKLIVSVTVSHCVDPPKAIPANTCSRFSVAIKGTIG